MFLRRERSDNVRVDWQVRWNAPFGVHLPLGLGRYRLRGRKWRRDDSRKGRVLGAGGWPSRRVRPGTGRVGATHDAG
eukprot:14344751-Alexandrium_andersonii.AAC.1